MRFRLDAEPHRVLFAFEEVLMERLVVHRLGEQEALAELTAEVAQRRDLLWQLDPFCNHVEIEAVADRDDRAGEARIALFGPEERAIHLEDVDREAAEVAQRRVAGP